MKQFLLTIECFLLLVGGVYSQWTSDVFLNTKIHDDPNIVQTMSMSASGLNGHVYVSWLGTYAGYYQLRMQLLDSNGIAKWGPIGIPVSNLPINSVDPFDIVTDNSGSAIVTFQVLLSGKRRIIAHKLDSSANQLWGVNGILLTDTNENMGMYPKITICNSNNIIIAWNAFNSSFSEHWIAFQKFSPNGNTLWPTINQLKDSGIKYSRQNLVPCGTDDFIMQYIVYTGVYPNDTSTIFANRYNNSGNTVWASPVKISTKTIKSTYYPAISTDYNNGFYISFDTKNPQLGHMFDVYCQHIDENGNLWNPIGIEAADTLKHKFGSDCIFLPLSQEFFTLIKTLNTSQDSSGIFLQKFDQTGNKLFGNNGKNIVPFAKYFEPLSINVVVDGLIIIYNQGTPFTFSNLMAVKVDFNGNHMWPSPVTICSNPSAKYDVTTVNISSLQLATIWSDTRNIQGIYAQNIGLYGNLGISTGIVKTTENKELIVYSNPGPCNTIQAELSSAGTAVLTLHDAFGNLVRTMNVIAHKGTNTFHFDTDNLPTGLYLLQLTSNNHHAVSKLIIQ
jgi:hypothetical protein